MHPRLFGILLLAWAWSSCQAAPAIVVVTKAAQQPTVALTTVLNASKVTAALTAASPAATATSGTGCTDHAPGEPDFTASCEEMAQAITCPRGIGQGENGVVLLVHGTGSTGAQSWQLGPYNMFLPATGRDICWIDLPQRSLGDAQVSGEYIAYNVPKLAAQSKTKTLAIIGHSQGGGLNIQWALLYWPAIRSVVTDCTCDPGLVTDVTIYGHSDVALAGDFKGTTVTPLVCEPEVAATGGCQPSVWQQTTGSHYLTAQNHRGGQALVTTTSIYSQTDEVVVPETGPGATSVLPGAASIALQTLCGPLYYQEHVSELISPPAYALALDALTHAGPASLSRVSSSTCTQIFQEFEETDVVVEALLLGFAAFPQSPRTPSEPSLKPYVCAAGDARAYPVYGHPMPHSDETLQRPHNVAKSESDAHVV